jgi:hypothetical protein
MATEPFTFGFLTINGKKVASVEEIQLETTREQDEIYPCDVVEAESLIPTRLKYKLTFKKAYTGSEFFKAIQQGTPMGAILFRKDISTNKVEAIRDVKGIIFDKNVLGPVTGNKHVLEDISAGATKVVALD